jgi:Spy/CpxP family protein refolding chaperone
MTGRGLVLAAVLTASGLAGAQDPPEAPARERGISGSFQGLQLSNAQREQLRQITLEARKGARRRQAEIDVLHLDIQDLLAAPTLDEAALSAKVQQLGDLQLASVRAEVDSRVAMRKILTPEQIEKMAELRSRRTLTGGGRPRR